MSTLKTSYKLTGWNTTQLRLRIPAILTTYGEVIGDEFKEQIKLVRYFWPRTTYRKNGTIEFGPGLRDIVDMGAFLRSQRKETIAGVGQYELRFTWNVPYARLILTGYTTNRGNVCPPRNWIEPALEAKPLDQFFAAYWQVLAKRKL